MSKYATKAAGNMFCQARYEAAKFNERLSSREGAAEELGVDRTRLARIELGSVIPYPEEVLLMADIYRAPELKGNYCREMCPLGKGMPKIENQDIDRIALRALCSFRKINEAKIAMIQNDISVNDLAEELGCSRCYLSSTLNGKNTSIEIRRRISDYLNISDSDN